jgi:predicted nucleic acid-binding protein
VQRRVPAAFEDAIQQTSIYQTAFLTPPTTDAILKKAAELARAHYMQLWDCVVCAAAVEAGAKVLMTEDMQDGRILDGLRLMNPFAIANADAIQDLWRD